MMQQCGAVGTGKAAHLDFTHSIGKTGTSSNYRDAWFIGFTGQYVAGVWLGNDDFTPMARVTGGSFPAQTWQTFMVAAHDTDNIADHSRARRSPGPGRRASAARRCRRAECRCRSGVPARPGRRERQGHVDRDEADSREDQHAAQGRPPLSPSDQKPDHAEAAPGASPKPNLAQAANADGAGEPATHGSRERRRRKARSSTVSDSGAPAPH